MNNEMMKNLGFKKEVEAVESSFCPFCKKPVTMEEFKDEMSKSEFRISGLCQKCQDEMFV